MEYEGRVYQTQMGQWNFFIKDSGQREYCRGRGFESEDEAGQKLKRLLSELTADTL